MSVGFNATSSPGLFPQKMGGAKSPGDEVGFNVGMSCLPLVTVQVNVTKNK